MSGLETERVDGNRQWMVEQFWGGVMMRTKRWGVLRHLVTGDVTGMPLSDDEHHDVFLFGPLLHCMYPSWSTGQVYCFL